MEDQPSLGRGKLGEAGLVSGRDHGARKLWPKAKMWTGDA